MISGFEMMISGLCRVIMNVQVDLDVEMTIAHPNLNYPIGWIAAISQSGEDAKTLWILRKEHFLLPITPISMSLTKNALG